MMIQVYRKRNGYSQTQLAEQLGVSQKSISHWEKGYCEPSIKLLIRMSELLHCTIDELVKGGTDGITRLS